MALVGVVGLASAAPTIAFQPTPQSTVFGGTVRFTVIASGDAPISYQWRKDGVDVADGGKVSGASTDVLELTDVRNDDAAGYSVVVSDASGSTTSLDAALSVNAPQGGDVDLSFDLGSSINSGVWGVVTQPDGRVLIAGSFTTVHGAARGRVARLNVDVKCADPGEARSRTRLCGTGHRDLLHSPAEADFNGVRIVLRSRFSH